ncbi:agnoprotein [Rhinolophus blasii polyomavirus 1]|nr:agnoprotein [Rhinolophus blasii polyomavirus 1]BAZ96601.1 agnoprotein [Rhinolophus simulator polyomavirus 4]
MGQANLLWQSLKCLLIIYNSQQSNRFSHLEEILELIQAIYKVIKEELPKELALKNAIFWELCTFKQKLRELIVNIIDKLKRKKSGVERSISSPPGCSMSCLAACPDMGRGNLATLPELADCPDGPSPCFEASSQDPPFQPQPQEIDSHESFLRKQLVLAQRLQEAVSDLQDVLL